MTAVADLNRDGIADLVVANGGTSSNTIGVLFGDGAGGFAPPVDYPAASFIGGLVAVDLDGDGAPDVVATDGSNQLILVFINRGDGTLRPAVSYSSPCATWLVAGDFNNDGHPDIASVNGGCSNVQLFLGLGDGSLSAALSFPIQMWSERGVAGDFNGDGALDLAVSEFQNAPGVGILLGDGAGHFTDGGNYSAGAGPAFIATGDFNGDGALDLVVSNNNDTTVSVLLGYGDGRFGSPTNLHVGTGGNPYGVLTSDVDGDGTLDIVVASEGHYYGDAPSNLSVLLGRGDGTFAASRDFATGEGPGGPVVADFNRDGRIDLAASDWYDVNASVLLSTGCPW